MHASRFWSRWRRHRVANRDLRGEIAASEKDTVRFAFVWPDFWGSFEGVDRRANATKVRSRRFGFMSVGLVLSALILATLDPWLPSGHAEAEVPWETIAAVLGVIGTVLGVGGVLHTSAKRRWLRDRLFTESARQFHFQWIVAHFDDIVDAAHDPLKQAAYLSARATAFDAFKSALDRSLDETLDRIVALEAEPIQWPARALPGQDDGARLTAAADALAAYRATRLDQQLDYAEWKLDASRDPSGLSPRRQERFFSAVGWTCIVIVVLLHGVHLFGHWIELPAAPLNVAVIITALVSLAGRALEDGLQPQREVERYEQYRASCAVALDRFDKAATLDQGIEVMRGFESVANEEMRLFLRVHARARFVL
jgi:hypothetical protein